MALELKKLAPWNWLRHEESEAANVPMQQGRSQIMSPDNPLQQFHQQVDRLFNSLLAVSGGFPAAMAGSGGWLRPSVDIAATDKQYIITAEVPGVDQNDVTLELADDCLHIRGEKKLEKEQKEKEFYRVERSYGGFRRVLSLPEDADRERIEARFKNGVLTITLPRKAEVVQSSNRRRIEIKQAA